MYYDKKTQTFYKNNQDVLKNMIFTYNLYEIGFSKWELKTKQIEIIPTDFYTQVTFAIYYSRYNKKYKIQKTVLQLKDMPKNIELFIVDKWIDKMLQTDNILTDCGKTYYKQVLSHFQKYNSIEELHKNLFIFSKNT